MQRNEIICFLHCENPLIKSSRRCMDRYMSYSVHGVLQVKTFRFTVTEERSPYARARPGPGLFPLFLKPVISTAILAFPCYCVTRFFFGAFLRSVVFDFPLSSRRFTRRAMKQTISFLRRNAILFSWSEEFCNLSDGLDFTFFNTFNAPPRC